MAGLHTSLRTLLVEGFQSFSKHHHDHSFTGYHRLACRGGVGDMDTPKGRTEEIQADLRKDPKSTAKENANCN